MSNNFSANISLNAGQSNKSISTLSKNVTNLTKELERLDSSIKKSEGSLSNLARHLGVARGATEQAAKTTQELVKQRQAAKSTADQAASAEKKLAGSVGASAQATQKAATATQKAGQATNSASSGARGLGAAQQDVAQKTRVAQQSTDAYSESLASHRYLMYDVGATYRTISTLLLAVPAATSAVAIAYEKDFAQVQRTTGLAGEAAADYQRQLKDLATEIPTTFGELAEVSKIGGQMGIANESLEQFTDTVVRFVETSDGVNIDKAATAFGRLENMFNVTPSGELADPNFFKRIGSAISYTGDNSVATEKAIIGMLEKTTASAKNAGLSIQETIAMSSAMVSSGLQPFLSSGFIIRFFGNFQKAAAAGGDAAASMARELGVTAEQFQEMVRNDPYQILHRVVTQMKDMDSVEGKQFLTRLGINGVQDPKVLNALSENLHVLEGAMDDVNKAYGEAGYLGKSSEGIFNTTAANIQKMINAFMNLGSTLSTSNLPVFNHMIKAISEIVSTVDNLIDRFAWARVGAGMLMAALTAGGVLAAFKSALAFTNASLVMFRDAAQKGALSGGRFGGITRQLAEIALYHKGATDQQVQSMMKGRSTAAAFATALTTLKGGFQQATGATQANTGALAANAAAQQRAAGATKAAAGANTAATTTVVAGTAAVGKQANEMARAQKSGGRFGAAMSVTGGILQSFLHPALLIPGALIGIGTAMLNASADNNAFRESVAGMIDGFNEFDGAYDAIINKFSEQKMGWFSTWNNRWSTLNKTLDEIAIQAGVTEEHLRDAFSNGTKGVQNLIDGLQEVRDELAKEHPFGNAQIDAQDVLIDQLKKIKKELEETDQAKRNVEQLGGAAENAFGETGDAALDAADSVNSFSQSLDDAMDTIFGMVNAELGLTKALEGMGKSLAQSVDVSGATAESAANIENYQRVVSSAIQLMQQQITEGTFATVDEASSYYEQFFLGLEQQLVSTGVDPAQAAFMTQQAIDVMQLTLTDENNSLVATFEADTTPAMIAVANAADAIAEFVDGRDMEFTLYADGQPATEVTWEVVNWIAEVMGITPEAVLDAVDGTATENTEAVGLYISEITGDDYIAELDADTSRAESAVLSFARWMHDVLGVLGGMLNALMTGLTGDPSFIVGNMTIPEPRQTSTIRPTKQSPAQRGRPDTKAPGQRSAPEIPQPNFGALNKGYKDAAQAANKAGNAAKGAGNAGKKAGDAGKKGADAAKKATDRAREAAEKAAQKARDWNKAWQDLQSWAGRVGEALTMAFDQKHAVQSAKDAYYTVLNGINDRLKQQKDRVKELREETARLTAERKVELNEAKKFEDMAALAAKHGNTDRAKDYRDQAKAMRERANEMSSQISANKAEQSTIQAGIGNLKGYSQAAIDNRNELRQLEQAALKVPQAYASIGASASTVAKQTSIWTGNVKTHARELGYTNKQVSANTVATSKYLAELKRVPRNIPTVVAAKHSGVPNVRKALDGVSKPRSASINPRLGPTSGVSRSLGRLANPRTATIGAAARNTGVAGAAIDRVANRRRTAYIDVVSRTSASSSIRLPSGAGARAGARAGRYMGGPVPAFNSGGLIPGKSPANPREDNLIANVDGRGHILVRSQEYIQPEPAVKYYGLDFMEDIRKMRLPKYYAGGSLGGSARSAQVQSGPVELAAKSVNQLAQAISQTVVLEVSREELARSITQGQIVNNQKKGIFNVGS